MSENIQNNGFPWGKMSALLGVFTTIILSVIVSAFFLFMDQHNDARYLKLGTHDDYIKSEADHFSTMQGQISKLWEATNKAQQAANDTGQQISLVNEKLSRQSSDITDIKSDLKMILYRRSGQQDYQTQQVK